MTGFAALALVAIAAVVVVAAVVFRSQRALAMLRFLRRIAWGYIIAIVALAAIYIVQDGGW